MTPVWSKHFQLFESQVMISELLSLGGFVLRFGKAGFTNLLSQGDLWPSSC